ncbi:unnamed protein product [Phytophthora fragariaefolia]|uniref:RxLR effector protein n=1 Tax=Phytophthora fragariaefolia TaxID=1490495 RepID=A0A9W6XU78_9STRA|nr:unnamed protein product [Phytophthora fragariaefolia]
MRLSSVLSALTVASLLVASNVLSAGAGHGRMVSEITPLDLSVPDVSPNAGVEKRSLRGLEAGGGEDEERLAGANLFNVEKLTNAMDNSKYASKLLLKWKRRGYTKKESIKAALDRTSLSKDPKLNTMYHTYLKWLDDFFPEGEKATNSILFSEKAIEYALADKNWAKETFKAWKAYGYGKEEALAQLNTLKLNTNDVNYLSKFYGTWLSVHHPSTETMNFANAGNLFTVDDIFWLQLKPEYRDNLFRAWATKYSLERVREKLAKLGVSDKSGVYKEYVTYLKTFFPKAGLS